MLIFQMNDGGRSAAGFKGTTGDCVCRAIAIASGMPYKLVYDALADGNANQRQTKRCKVAGRRTAREGIYVQQRWFRELMVSWGFRWVACMSIGSGCVAHLRSGDLPPGRLVVRVSKHVCAVIDGVIHDNQDHSRGGNRCVYGYWIFESSIKSKIAPSALTEA